MRIIQEKYVNDFYPVNTVTKFEIVRLILLLINRHTRIIHEKYVFNFYLVTGLLS